MDELKMTLTYKQRLGRWWDVTSALFCMAPIFCFVCLGANRVDWIIGTALLTGILLFVPPFLEK